MEIIIACWIGSIVISIFIGNIVGIHYLNKLDKNWKISFDEVKQTTLDAIDKLTDTNF